jgi:hypothetical protein
MSKKSKEIESGDTLISHDEVQNTDVPAKKSYKEQIIENTKMDTYPGKEKIFDKYLHEKMGDYVLSFDDDKEHTVVYFNPVTKKVKVAKYSMGE